MARACLAVISTSFALTTASVRAHPHGSASCTVSVIYDGANISKVNVMLELDAEHSIQVFESMRIRSDGTFTAEQKARMQNNLAFLFAPLNYLVSLKTQPEELAQAIVLRSKSRPDIERTEAARLRITAQLTREGVAQQNESNVTVQCADPSWNWLVGFKDAPSVTANRQCVTKLGDNFVYALPTNLPSSDGPSLKVTAEHLPRSQQVSLACS